MKYKEGDIIIKEDCWYICEIAGETKSLFYKKNISLGCISGVYNTSLILRSNPMSTVVSGPKYKDDARAFCRTNAQPKYPVVGTSVRCSPLFLDMYKLSKEYPEILAPYLKNVKDSMKAAKPSKKKTKKKNKTEK